MKMDRKTAFVKSDCIIVVCFFHVKRNFFRLSEFFCDIQ
jgi:hypothetical protein